MADLFTIIEEAAKAAASTLTDTQRGILLRALDRTVQMREPFTTDAVWLEAQAACATIREDCEGRALGNIMRQAAAAGTIRACGFAESTDKASHGRPKRLWVRA